METKMDGRWRLFRIPDEFRLRVRRRLHGRGIPEDGIISEMAFRKARVPRRIITQWITKGMLLPVALEDEASEIAPPADKIVAAAVTLEEPRKKRQYIRKDKTKQAAAPRTEGK